MLYTIIIHVIHTIYNSQPGGTTMRNREASVGMLARLAALRLAAFQSNRASAVIGHGCLQGRI